VPRPSTVQRFTLALSREVVLGKRSRFTLRAVPDRALRIRALYTSALRGMVKLNCPSVGVIQPGDATEVCQSFNAMGPPELDLAVIGPPAVVIANCEYSGDVPTPLSKGSSFLFILTLQGPLHSNHLKRVK
jgi:hypothetical protein